MEPILAKEFLYRVKDNDTIKDLCSKFNTSKSNIVRNNDDIDLYTGEWIKVKVNDYISHFVKPMESLSKIAEIYDVSVEKLKSDNDLSENRLYIGQLIKIYKPKD